MMTFREKSTCCKLKLPKRRNRAKTSINKWCSRRLRPLVRAISHSRRSRRISRMEALAPKTTQAEMLQPKFLLSLPLTPAWFSTAIQTCKVPTRLRVSQNRELAINILRIYTIIKIHMVTRHLILRLPSNSHTLETNILCSHRFNNRVSSNIYHHNTCPTRIWMSLLRPTSMSKINTHNNLLQFHKTRFLLSQQYNIKPWAKLMETNNHHPQINLCQPFKSWKHERQNSRVSSLRLRSPNKGQKSLSWRPKKHC